MSATMIGQRLGSFQIESRLGAGAMGVVFRAVNVNNGKPAAIKIVGAEYSQRNNANERFSRESEILQQFRHPNIVRLLAVGRYQGTSYFAMEFIEGPTLEKLLESREMLPWTEVVDIALQTSRALHYAHERGVVHRDLKPANLIINPEGTVKLADFGIAKDLDAVALTAPGRTLGTASYMAPEQIRGTPEVSHKTDLYALGVLMYQMITGKLPFSGGSVAAVMHAHLTAPPPRPSDKNPEIPKALDELVYRLMAKEPQDRPWDAQAVEVKLGELADKVTRNEAVAMVRAELETVDMNSTSAALTKDVAAALKKSKKKKKRKRTESFELPFPRQWLEIGGLVLCLAAGAIAIGYFLWPPSAKYLVNQAEVLMKSESPADWRIAKSTYLDELERRFPAHPYKEKTQGWLDRITLHQVERRAAVLEKPNLTGISKPKGETERLYFEVYQDALKLSEAGKDIDAVKKWRDMASAIRSNPEDRGWLLLAEKREADLVAAIAERRQDAERLLKKADDHVFHGRVKEAIGARREVIDQYERNPELADVVEKARQGLAELDAQAPVKKDNPADNDEPKASSAPGQDAPATPETDRNEGPPAEKPQPPAEPEPKTKD